MEAKSINFMEAIANTMSKRIFILLTLCTVFWLTACGNRPGDLEPPIAITRIVSTATAVNPTAPALVDTATFTAMPTQNNEPLPPATATFPVGYVPPTVEPTSTFAPPPTSTPLPLTDPVIQDATTLPATSQDALFIADGALKLWDHLTGQVEPLLTGGTPPDIYHPRHSEWSQFAGDVVDYSTSHNGRRLIVSRYMGRMDDSGSSTSKYDLFFVNLADRQLITIATNLVDLGSFAISPDGTMAAYIARTPEHLTEWDNNTLWLMDLPTGNIRASIMCNGPCKSIVWDATSTHVLWSDRSALWLQDVATNQANMILANHAGEGVPAGEVSVYRATEWSPDGRYLLGWKGYYEGAQRVVIDPVNKMAVELEGGLAYIGPTIQIMWTQDSRLYLLRPNSGDNQLSKAELWHIVAGEGQLVLDESQVISQKALMLSAPQQLSDGRLTYALVTYADNLLDYNAPTIPSDPDSGLYFLSSLTAQPQRVSGITPTSSQDDSQITWLPDGTGAIIRQSQPDITLYAATDNTNLYNINALLGLYPHRFTWIELP